MTWPASCEHGVDLSANQETLDIDRLIDANPDVTRWVLRAENVFGKQDAKFPYFYDRLVARGHKPDVYLWPDPNIPVARVMARWRAALRGREPHSILVGDFEWSRAKWKMATGKDPIRTITDDVWLTLAAADEITDRDVVAYTSGRFWNENVTVHGYESEYKFWVPHYPTWWRGADGSWLQARTFDQLEAHLPIEPESLNGRGWYWPHIGEAIPLERVIGWQFSEKGRLPGYDRDLDLGLWIKQGPPKPTIPEKVDRLWNHHPEIWEITGGANDA